MIVLGLGSNIEDRNKYLQQAIAMIRDQHVLEEVVESPIYKSEAVLLPDSPPEWNIPYLNMAIGGESKLIPTELLVAVKAIENEIGRQDRGRWGPREIDIDILIYHDQRVNTPDLIIPHPRLMEREFALKPLLDVCPEWQE